LLIIYIFFSFFFTEIDFRKKELSLSIQTLPDDLSHTYLNFGFCLKSLEGEIAPRLLGLTRINFSDVLKDALVKKCPVVMEDGLRIGEATFEINMERAESSREGELIKLI
jgi:hypothetical protein